MVGASVLPTFIGVVRESYSCIYRRMLQRHQRSLTNSPAPRFSKVDTRTAEIVDAAVPTLSVEVLIRGSSVTTRFLLLALHLSLPLVRIPVLPLLLALPPNHSALPTIRGAEAPIIVVLETAVAPSMSAEVRWLWQVSS